MKLSALDENGKAVDWWFLYKVPKLVETKQAGVIPSATGYEYVYYDPQIGKVRLSQYTLTAGDGALGRTLNSVFPKPDATTGWILYNDEMPESVGRSDNPALGHTKGVIAFDTGSNSAYWLLHSWPKYADPGAPGMPTPMYGQTFLCISLDLATASKVAAQMATHQEPQVYMPRIPHSAPTSDSLYRLTRPLDPNAIGDSDSIDYRSVGGLPFKVIAKNRKWGKDFWNDLVGPSLDADMDVESWIRGPIPPILDSDGIHKVFDIKYIDLRAPRSKVGLAGNQRPCKMGHNYGQVEMGLRWRHQPHDLAGEPRRRNHRISG